MTIGPRPLCLSCKRLKEFPYCEAFPAGIPVEIASRQFDHHFPFPGDGGKLYVPIADAPDEALLPETDQGTPTHERKPPE